MDVETHCRPQSSCSTTSSNDTTQPVLQHMETVNLLAKHNSNKVMVEATDTRQNDDLSTPLKSDENKCVKEGCDRRENAQAEMSHKRYGAEVCKEEQNESFSQRYTTHT